MLLGGCRPSAAWNTAKPPTMRGGPMSEYDTDFYQCTQAHAAHLRAKSLGALDIDHLAEEIESLGAIERRAIRSHLRVLLMHRLKWALQVDRRSESWRSSMYTARVFIEET
jgi:hypothetical protein